MSENLLSSEEVLAFLTAIEKGETTVVPLDGEPQVVYCGNVRYQASNGWVVLIFNDANEWDYVDAIYAENGDEIYSISDDPSMDDVFDYKLSDELAWKIWRIPGHCHFRCTGCSQEIRPPSWEGTTGDTLCVDCGGTAVLPFRPCPTCRRENTPGDEMPNGVCFWCHLHQQVEKIKASAKEGTC